MTRKHKRSKTSLVIAHPPLPASVIVTHCVEISICGLLLTRVTSERFPAVNLFKFDIVFPNNRNRPHYSILGFFLKKFIVILTTD